MRGLWILVVILAGSLTGYLVTRFEGREPGVQTQLGPMYVGDQHTHEFRVSDEGTGLESVRVWLSQGDRRQEIFAQEFAGNLFTGAELEEPRAIRVTLKTGELGLTEGRAMLHLEAADYSWRGNRTHVEIPLVIDTRAPRIQLRSGLTYARRGGAELAVYSIDEEKVEDGVELGELRFPGFPHPEDASLRVSFYAIPYDVDPRLTPRVFAVDRAGNRSELPLPVRMVERSFPNDEIELSDGFMSRKVAELLGRNSTGTLEGYLKLNDEMRHENARKVFKICQRSSEDRLWSGAFKQLPGSRVGARFAEKRKYRYQGSIVDRQTHLGYDLASTAHATVPAANDGVVVYSDPLGIYGNTVILDHGLGLFTLYGHLSDFAVQTGQAVHQGEPLGHTGTTGLAGGDHLHFSVLVSGVFVDPLEWFDARWIREHVEPKLGAAVREAL
ncbi:MAG: M23 family metallopeptidase [Myxococcota bacterium]